VLFLDEAPEFSGRALDALRQPLESGHVVVARAAGVMRLPARFMLVLAANPCPCGRYSAIGGGCDCSPSAVRRYQSRLSGPLLDRIDLRVQVEAVSRSDLISQSVGESTAVVAERVQAARDRQAHRYRDTAWNINSEIPGPILRREYPLDAGSLKVLENLYAEGRLTARGFDRVARLAWTLADLAGVGQPTAELTHQAFQLRSGAPLTALSDARSVRGNSAA